MALNGSARLYLFGVLVHVLLSLTPLSTLHPDEWMQSAEVMATQLLPRLPHATTWDWQFTCYNQLQPAHLPHALRPTHNDEEWRRAMQRSVDAAAALSPPTWLQCPDDMQIQAPIRNTLFPWLSSGLPYQLYRWAWERTLPESADSAFAASGRWPVMAGAPWLLFLLPRVAMLLLSIACDLALYRAARTWFPGSAKSILAAYSTTFPALVFMGRTFSNAMETALLAASLWIASAASKRARSQTFPSAASSSSTPVAATASSLDGLCLLFGALVGAAALVRLSFLFWAWPIGVALIGAHFSMRQRAPTRGISAAVAMAGSAARVSFLVVLSSAAVGLVLCVADSLYYRTLWLCDARADRCSSGISEALATLAAALLSGYVPQLRGSLLLTPLANYAYNSDADNVAHHGRHPHFLHATVNLLLLLGPVAYARLLLASWRAVAAACRGGGTEKGAPSPQSTNIQQAQLQVPHSGAGRTEPELQALSLRSRKALVKQQVVSPAVADSPQRSSNNPSATESTVSVWVDAMLVAVAWSGVLLLSLIPHQEPRFLLPIIIPAAMLARPSPADVAASSKQRSVVTGDRPARWRYAVSTLHLLHGVCTVLLLGVLHQGGLLPTLVRPDLWRHLAPSASSPSSCGGATPVPGGAASAPQAPESWLLLSYKSYTLPTAFVHAHVREVHAAMAPPCAPAPILSVIDVGDEQAVAARVAQALREQHVLYSASTPSAPPLRLHRVLLLWPGSVIAPVQQLRDAHAALLPSLARNLTAESEVLESRAAPASGPSHPVLQALCPSSAKFARECALLRGGGSANGGGSAPPSLYSTFPHLSLDDAPNARGGFSIQDQLALHATVFDMQLMPDE